MKSIVKAFADLLKIPLERTTDTDNIIFGQASRHVIVHASAKVDDRMVKQVSGATKRTLKSDLVSQTALRFTPEEIHTLAGSMKAYVENLCTLLDQRVESPP